MLSYCSGFSCAQPFTRIHPDGSVVNLAEAMDPKYDSLYAGFKKLDFYRCAGAKRVDPLWAGRGVCFGMPCWVSGFTDHCFLNHRQAPGPHASTSPPGPLVPIALTSQPHTGSYQIALDVCEPSSSTSLLTITQPASLTFFPSHLHRVLRPCQRDPGFTPGPRGVDTAGRRAAAPPAHQHVGPLRPVCEAAQEGRRQEGRQEGFVRPGNGYGYSMIKVLSFDI